MSFKLRDIVDLPDNLYVNGIKAVYELNEIDLLEDVFLWACERYAVIRQSFGDPDPFRLKYRNDIRDLISKIIRNGINSKDASKLIKEESESLSPEAKTQFVKAVETEILSLHEGNFARYRVSPNEFEEWKETWYNH